MKSKVLLLVLLFSQPAMAIFALPVDNQEHAKIFAQSRPEFEAVGALTAFMGDEVKTIFCTATLLDATHIVTAAPCLAWAKRTSVDFCLVNHGLELSNKHVKFQRCATVVHVLLDPSYREENSVERHHNELFGRYSPLPYTVTVGVLRSPLQLDAYPPYISVPEALPVHFSGIVVGFGGGTPVKPFLLENNGEKKAAWMPLSYTTRKGTLSHLGMNVEAHHPVIVSYVFDTERSAWLKHHPYGVAEPGDLGAPLFAEGKDGQLVMVGVTARGNIPHEKARYYAAQASVDQDEKDADFDQCILQFAKIWGVVCRGQGETIFAPFRYLRESLVQWGLPLHISPTFFKRGPDWRYTAAEEGNTQAMLDISQSFMGGLGEEIDLTEALTWLERAVEGHNPLAWLALGLRYGRGDGVEENKEKAHEYFSKAAKHGFHGGEVLLAYYYGEDTLKDLGEEEKAIYWYRKLAEKGETKALSLLIAKYKDQLPTGKESWMDK